MSKMVKLVFIDRIYSDWDDPYNTYELRQELASGIHDWEEISDEDYEFMAININHFKHTGIKPIILTKDEMTIEDVKINIKQRVEKLRVQEDAKQKAAEEARQKRIKTADEKKQIKMRKQYEDLKKHFEDQGNN